MKLIIARESPKWILCDAGYGKTKNQILMRAYSGKVWSAFTNSGSNIPIWNTIREVDGTPLPEEDWQYHVSIIRRCVRLLRTSLPGGISEYATSLNSRRAWIFYCMRYRRLMLRK